MGNRQGYYSIIQYSEVPERLEFVNIGVVVFSEDEPRVTYRFVTSAKKINKTFNLSLGAHFGYLKKSIESRLENEFSNRWGEEELNRFIALRSGKVRMTPLKSLLIEELSNTVDELFELLVGEDKPKQRRLRSKTRLKNAFREENVEYLLDDKPEPHRLSTGLTVKPDYGYQNGKYNLIKAVSLNGDTDEALERVAGLAWEGKWLTEETGNTKLLNVVGDITDQEDVFIKAIRNQMFENKVPFYSFDDVPALAKDIRKNVH